MGDRPTVCDIVDTLKEFMNKASKKTSNVVNTIGAMGGLWDSKSVRNAIKKKRSDNVKKELEILNPNQALNLYMNYQNQFDMDIPTFLKVHGVKDSNPFKQFIGSINLITGSKKSQVIDHFSNPLLNDLLS